MEKLKGTDMEKLKGTELKWVEQISGLMDSKFRIPGTNIRFGLDPILGMIPFMGELSTLGISGALIYTMMRNGASGKIVTLMILNALLDTIFGSIPIIGDIFDFFFKANNKNIQLLKEHYHEGKHQGSGKGIIITVLVVFLLVFILMIWLLLKLSAWLWLQLKEMF